MQASPVGGRLMLKSGLLQVQFWAALCNFSGIQGGDKHGASVQDSKKIPSTKGKGRRRSAALAGH